MTRLVPPKRDEPIDMGTEMPRLMRFLEALDMIKKCIQNPAHIELIKAFEKAKQDNGSWDLIHAIEDLYNIKLSGSEKVRVAKLLV